MAVLTESLSLLMTIRFVVAITTITAVLTWRSQLADIFVSHTTIRKIRVGVHTSKPMLRRASNRSNNGTWTIAKMNSLTVGIRLSIASISERLSFAGRYELGRYQDVPGVILWYLVPAACVCVMNAN